VLAIIALLASVAIPTLVGYIDKADDAEITQDLTVCAKALQSWGVERYGDQIIGYDALVVSRSSISVNYVSVLNGDTAESVTASFPVQPGYSTISPTNATTWLEVVKEYAKLDLDPDVWEITDVVFNGRNILTHFWLHRSDLDQSLEYKGGSGEGSEDDPTTPPEPPEPPDTPEPAELFALFIGDFGGNTDTFNALDAKKGTDGLCIDTGTGGGGPDTGVLSEGYSIVYPGNYRIEVWGAEGGKPTPPPTGESFLLPGKGGYSVGTVYLDEGTKLFIHAGGQENTKKDGGWFVGGYNGGGRGKSATSSIIRNSGGGGSDVRIGVDDPYYRVIVAGGGGGAAATGLGTATQDNQGLASGGGERGVDGGSKSSSAFGSGGTQSAGGKSSSSGKNNPASQGSFLKGGESYSDAASCGGGGGWYGGGSALPGGGGSGWIFTEKTYGDWVTGESSKTESARDFSKYKLTSKYWLTGATTIPGTDSMPDPLDTTFDPDNPASTTTNTMIGKAGGGFVRITYLED
jgi:type II secretory pathway pseudopilin PulG